MKLRYKIFAWIGIHAVAFTALFFLMGAVSIDRSGSRAYLNTALDVSADGNTGKIDMAGWGPCGLGIDLTTLTGTSPTIDFLVETSADAVNWQPWSDPTICSAVCDRTDFSLVSNHRNFKISWVKGGTVTGATANLYLTCRKP